MFGRRTCCFAGRVGIVRGGFRCVFSKTSCCDAQSQERGPARRAVARWRPRPLFVNGAENAWALESSRRHGTTICRMTTFNIRQTCRMSTFNIRQLCRMSKNDIRHIDQMISIYMMCRMLKNDIRHMSYSMRLLLPMALSSTRHHVSSHADAAGGQAGSGWQRLATGDDGAGRDASSEITSQTTRLDPLIIQQRAA